MAEQDDRLRGRLSPHCGKRPISSVGDEVDGLHSIDLGRPQIIRAWAVPAAYDADELKMNLVARNFD